MQPLHNPLFVQFIVYFNTNQDYFECHEVLEEYWKSLPNATKDHPLTAYILLSTGLYHFRRGNTTGALRTLQKASARMTTSTEDFSDFAAGIDMNCLLADLKKTMDRLEKDKPFESFLIGISTPDLDLLAQEMAHSMDLLPLGSDDVIHKHMLRDRSDILLAREIAKAKGTPRN